VELEEMGRDLDTAGEQLERVARRLPVPDGAGRVFGGDGPGQLGAVGQALGTLQAEALTARAAEVSRTAAAAADLADRLGRVAASYRDVEAESAWRS
jgi:hypothetical protein